MCGIHGFNFEDRKLIEKMMRCSAHRGPDDEGLYVGGEISLGHNRLSIIDLSEKGRQPMWDSKNRYALVFNGEIYNYKLLRADLAALGHTFISETDSEVLLTGYIEWGADVVTKLDGIFAFAIWDSQNKELFLARDHVGVKPLYYYFNEGVFVFSSEIKSILEHNIQRKLNLEAFNLYCAVSYVPGPSTLFHHIYKLLPAHFMRVKGGKIEINQYWTVGSEPYITTSKSEIEKTVRSVISRSVEEQLVSDRPLGVYLSGGIDSSIVLSCIKKVRDNIDTFSVGFNVEGHEEPVKFNADVLLARKTAQHFGTQHHEVLIDSQDFIESIHDIVWHMDEPISNPTAVAMYRLAEFTKKNATVVLGGEGGDELFAGYDYFRLNRAADIFAHVPFNSSLKHISGKFKKLGTQPGVERYSLFMMRNRNETERYVPLFNYEKALDFFKKSYFNHKASHSADSLMRAHRESWLVDHALMLTDKMSMAFAVEVRVPLLAKNVVEYALRIPAHHKANLFDTKIILKEAFKNDIPDYLLSQPKRGWFSPGAKWLRHGSVYSFVKDVLSPDFYTETSSLFDWSALQEMLESHRRGEYYRIPIWSALTFQLWAKKFNIRL